MDDIDTFLDFVNFEYLQRFKDSGYDDLDFIKSLADEEHQEMPNLVGMSRKPGHILKFKKAIYIYILYYLSPVGLFKDNLQLK
jgi:hypothetical protein